MRNIVLGAFVTFLISSAMAQPSFQATQRDMMVRHYCGAPHLTSGPEYEEVKGIAQRLAVADPRIHIAVAYSPVVNAWEVELSPDASLICVPVGLVHFMGKVEGELAFILAHEIGHATDERCKTPSGRARIVDHSKSGAVLTLLLGGSNGNGAGEQRACESRADELGFNLMTRAGYDPNDAATAFEKLSLYLGDTATGPFARLAALGKDHPITPDRTRHMRKLMARQSRRSLP